MIGIKDQYFGTEIEMTGITRQRAAEVVAEMFGTEAYYDGTTYGVWSVIDLEGKKWKFMSDGSIYTQRKVYGRIVDAGGEYSTEMVSPKLSYDEMGKLQEVVRCLRQHGGFVNESWGSNGPMPINRPVSCLPGVFRYGNPQNRIHVTEKPLQLMKDVIQICEPRGLILDPFVGAGTTVLAAVMTGYRAVGIEVTDAYYKLGSDRVKIALEAEQKEDEK